MTATLDGPQVVRYEPRGAILDLWRNREALVLCTGPAGTGKTMGALWKLHLTALQLKVKALLVRQTHLSLTGTTLVTFEEQVAAAGLASGVVRWFGGSGRQPSGYRYPSTGSFIAVGGLDKPAKFLGGEYDRILVDEANETSEDAIETLFSRLRGVAPTYRQLAMLCNPDSPTHWLKERAKRGQLTILESLHRDNPAFVNRDGSFTERGVEYFAKLDALTGLRRLRYRDGLWVAAEGVIYDEFRNDIHVRDLPAFDPDTRLCSAGVPWEWPRLWGIDFGYVHPFVLQRWAVDPDGALWLYAEQYHSGKIVEEHVRDLKSQVIDRQGRWTEPRPLKILADHDAEDRATFRRHMGLATVAADKRVSVGLQAVKERLAVRGNGRPQLYVTNHAPYQIDPVLVDAKQPTSTLAEFGLYVWADKGKEAPQKENDDGMDCVRYVVADLDLRGAPRIRSFNVSPRIPLGG